MGNREPLVGVSRQSLTSHPSRTPPGTRPRLHPRISSPLPSLQILCTSRLVHFPPSHPPGHALPRASSPCSSPSSSLVLCRTPLLSLLCSLFVAHLSEVHPAIFRSDGELLAAHDGLCAPS